MIKDVTIADLLYPTDEDKHLAEMAGDYCSDEHEFEEEKRLDDVMRCRDLGSY